MLTLIQRNAAELKELHAKVRESVKWKSRSQVDFEAWQEACRQFHARYDSLAFPGGLLAGLERIKQGDQKIIETALNYLEDPPYCYRSQYAGTALRRAINKAILKEPLASRYAEWKSKRARTMSSSEPLHVAADDRRSAIINK